MAPLSIVRVLLTVAFPLFAIELGVDGSLAQGSREDGTQRAINSAVRKGEFDQAAAILKKAAESGSAEAQYQLASLYRSGRGVPQDDAMAFKWMKAAAEQGHKNAQFNLAKMYLAGRGVALDADQARLWLRKAAAQGYEEASKLLADVEAQRPAAPKASNPKATTRDAKNDRAPAASGALQAAARNGRPAILDAAWRGQADAIRQLISTGADVQARDEDGNTALALAAAAGKIAAVDALLSAGADVHARNKISEQPLMLAASKGHVDVVDRLLEKGADATAKTQSGITALTLAVRGCHGQAVKSLIDRGADAKDRSRRGRVAAHACRRRMPRHHHSIACQQGCASECCRRQRTDRRLARC